MNDDVVKTDAGRPPLQTEWNATAADYPREMCVQELFEAEVWTKTPEGLSRELCVKILKTGSVPIIGIICRNTDVIAHRRCNSTEQSLEIT